MHDLQEGIDVLESMVAAVELLKSALIRPGSKRSYGEPRVRAGRFLVVLEEVDAEAVGVDRVVHADDDDDEVLVLAGGWVAHPRVVLVGAEVEGALLRRLPRTVCATSAPPYDAKMRALAILPVVVD